MALIDQNSVLKLIDLNVKKQSDELANFKRNDVWSVVWADDNPEMFATMEKIKLNIFNGLEAEVNRTLNIISYHK
jgi:WD repeat-containing protein 35